MERVAPEKPLASQEYPSKKTIFFYGLIGIGRTGRIKAAVPAEERGEE
jgi:hypothetical protein